MATHVFGLTGGIASGKSSVAKRFRARGLPVIDADELAREAVSPASPVLEKLQQTFEGVVSESGVLDRQKLAARVFADPAERAKLNALVHPEVGRLLIERVARLEKDSEPLVCYEVPLLFETGRADQFRPVVLVSAPEEAQIKRAMARSGLSEEAARARIQAQLPLSEKVRGADIVIENDGTLRDLEARADQALDEVCRRVRIDPARFPKPVED